MEQSKHNIPSDVIDLRELFAILKKRKILIFSLTAFLTIFAIVYAFFIAKPVYEVKSMIEIGQISEKGISKPIDDIKDVKNKLSYEYQVNLRGKKIELPRVTSISVPKGSKGILSLTIHGYSNEEATQYIRTVIKKIKKQYKAKTNAYISNQKTLVNMAQNDIEENKKELHKMQKNLDDYNQRIIALKSEDAALAGIYALQISQKQSDLQELRKYISELTLKKEELKLSLTPLMMKPTQTVGETEILDHPIKPKKKLIIVIAFIVGLTLSVFLAFFLEFVGNIKKEC